MCAAVQGILQGAGCDGHDADQGRELKGSKIVVSARRLVNI